MQQGACSKGVSWASEAFSLSWAAVVRCVLQGSSAGVYGACVRGLAGVCRGGLGSRPPAARSGKQGSRMLIVTGRPCLIAVVCPGVGSSCYPSHERFVLLATPPSKSVVADIEHPAFLQFITLSINHI